MEGPQGGLWRADPGGVHGCKVLDPEPWVWPHPREDWLPVERGGRSKPCPQRRLMGGGKKECCGGG